MNLPNLITLSRIPTMFVIVWLMYCSWWGAATLAFWLFIASAIGLARRLPRAEEESRFQFREIHGRTF